MAIGALQTGYTTLYGKVAGLGTQNGQTRGSSFREHIDGTEKKAPYQHLAQNGTITYKGVTFVYTGQGPQNGHRSTCRAPQCGRQPQGAARGQDNSSTRQEAGAPCQ